MINCSKFIFTSHSLKAIISRGITAEEMMEVVTSGEIIADPEL